MLSLLFLACWCGGAGALLQRPGPRVARGARIAAAPGAADKPPADVSKALRIATLCSVPVVWGTYSPAVRFVYQQPVPPPGVVFSAAYYVVALATLFCVTLLRQRQSGPEEASSAVTTPLRSADTAGAELGGYLFLGNCAQVVGLETTSADTAAFLVQTTTILVPLLASLGVGGGLTSSLTGRTFKACALAFFGVLLLFSDAANAESFASLRGDALVCCAAFFYSLHVLRLGALVQNVDPLRLALAKAKFETVYAILTVAGLLALTPAVEIHRFLEAFPSLSQEDMSTLALATLWCGSLTCAYTIWAQSFGQRAVGPAQANLIYTSQPIFSTIFAVLLLDERPTTAIFTGGACIIAAILFEISSTEEDPVSNTN